ncbi:carbon storage regulator [Lysobacter sp. CA199]|uniref:carbon storage regulator n=1 Tax=Lysobacter sp. CA199 TaxID=3455608 RepID=UPI003F8D81E8
MRRPFEAILIGNEIEVRVLRVNCGEVRFGLTAPRDVAILRGELLGRPADHPSRQPKLKNLPPADEAPPRWWSGSCGGGGYPPADGAGGSSAGSSTKMDLRNARMSGASLGLLLASRAAVRR